MRLALFIAFLAIALPAAAQPAVTAPPGAGVSLALAGGVSVASRDAGAALGASGTFTANDWIALEASVGWLDRGLGTTALSATGSLLVHLRPAGKAVVPYAAVGGGLYRTSFDLGRVLGMMASSVPAGTVLVPIQGTAMFGMMGGAYGGPSGWSGHMWNPATQGPWPGPVVTVGQMPMFYTSRLGPMSVPARGLWPARAFADPAVALGGGLRLDVSRHVTVRPDVRAFVVLANGDAYTVGVFAFHIGYRF